MGLRGQGTEQVKTGQPWPPLALGRGTLARAVHLLPVLLGGPVGKDWDGVWSQ